MTRHHKAKRSTNLEFNVARFLPVQLGHVMYKYLVFIRPLSDMLQQERSSLYDSEPLPSSRLLFRTGHGVGKP
jgi:hypothetical protein